MIVCQLKFVPMMSALSLALRKSSNQPLPNYACTPTKSGLRKNLKTNPIPPLLAGKSSTLGGLARKKVIMSSVVIVSEAEALREEVAIYKAALQKIVHVTKEWQANRLGSVFLQRKRWERCAEIAQQAIEAAQPLQEASGCKHE